MHGVVVHERMDKFKWVVAVDFIGPVSALVAWLVSASYAPPTAGPFVASRCGCRDRAGPRLPCTVDLAVAYGAATHGAATAAAATHAHSDCSAKWPGAHATSGVQHLGPAPRRPFASEWALRHRK